MRFPALEEAQGKLDAARKELFGIMQEAKTSSNGVFDLTKVKSLSGDNNERLATIQGMNEALTEMKAEVEKQQSLKDAAMSVSDFEEIKGSVEHEEKREAADRSFGELFVKSEAFKNKGAKAHLDVDLKTLFERPSGWTPEATRSGLVTLKPMVPAPSVSNHIVTIPVSQTAYKYMEETTYDTDHAGNLAGETAEGGTFVEAQLALTERSQTVEKITVWLPMTDEQLEDEPGARAYVEARLENMIRQRLDVQILAGTGSTPLLLGTNSVSGIQSQALGADTLLDASYKLFDLVRTDGFAEPSIAFTRPTHWQPVMLLKTADGQYIYANPATGGPQSLWGVPVVTTMASPSGLLIAGDYANYAFLGVKRGIDVQVTNSHSDYFVKGKQAIRLDMRCVMVHIRPKAFGKVTGLA